MENRRLDDGRVLQRHVLHLGEISESQEHAWRRSIEVFDEQDGAPRTLSRLAQDHCKGLTQETDVVRLCLSQLRLCRPRQGSPVGLAWRLQRQPGLYVLGSEHLSQSRKGTRWHRVLFVLVASRLLSPRSEWRPHLECYAQWRWAI